MDGHKGEVYPQPELLPSETNCDLVQLCWQRGWEDIPVRFTQGAQGASLRVG